MAAEAIYLRLQAEFDYPPEAIQTVVDLLEAGATPHFIARYRRDETKDLGEARVFELAERLAFLADLETRKQAIRQQAKERDQLTDELEDTLVRCFDQDLLDDIYQTFRPSRRTLGVQAREKGLGPLADSIFTGDFGRELRAAHPNAPAAQAPAAEVTAAESPATAEPEDASASAVSAAPPAVAASSDNVGAPDGTALPAAADALIDEAQGLPTREAVLEGVLHILAERLAADPALRGRVRRELHGGILTSKVVGPNAKNANRFKRYFEFEQPVRRIPANQMLDLWHGERDGVLAVSLSLPEDKSRELVRRHAAIETGGDPVLGQFLDLVFAHTYELLRSSCETDVRHQIKERVDRATASNLARNLRAQLMAPPLGSKVALGVRASRNTAWLAMLGEDGSVLEHRSLELANDEQKAASLDAMRQLIEQHRPAGIAVPHGRHQEVTTELLAAALGSLGQGTPRPMVVPVDEAASSIHATGQASRRQWPGVEVGVRTAISLASRLQDALLELLSLEPRALGLGHALDEVHQGLLGKTLNQTISSCVAMVGTDVNRASSAHLQRVPGLGAESARRISEHRKRQGPFRTLAALRGEELLSDLEFEQAAGFLRVFGGDEPLDATGIHPENYPLAERLAAAEGCSTAELLGRRMQSHSDALVDDQHGSIRAKDTMFTLARHGRDVRGELHAIHNAGVQSIADLRRDMELQGRVTNLTEFGAFVDLGIHQDALVHISQIPPARIRDERRVLAVGEVVTVYVGQVDVDKKRISLSMFRPRHVAEGRQPTLGERMQSGGGNRRGRQAAPEPFSRAARAPSGRRPGGMRSGPRPKSEGDGERRGGFGGGRGRDRDRDRSDRGGNPKVVTIESERPVTEVRGHNGELTSLSSLANLLGKKVRPEAEPESPPASE